MSFYGDPRGVNGNAAPKWERENLVILRPPFVMTFLDKPVLTFRMHKKCAGAMANVLAALWDASGRDQDKIDDAGVSIFGGAYNYRVMRNGHSLSMHAFGCAIDLDPQRNGMGDRSPAFARHPWVLKAFRDEGAEWGGGWGTPDGMHWQFARTR